jgi:hypothetical protein
MTSCQKVCLSVPTTICRIGSSYTWTNLTPSVLIVSGNGSSAIVYSQTIANTATGMVQITDNTLGDTITINICVTSYLNSSFSSTNMQYLFSGNSTGWALGSFTLYSRTIIGPFTTYITSPTSTMCAIAFNAIAPAFNAVSTPVCSCVYKSPSLTCYGTFVPGTSPASRTQNFDFVFAFFQQNNNSSNIDPFVPSAQSLTFTNQFTQTQYGSISTILPCINSDYLSFVQLNQAYPSSSSPLITSSKILPGSTTVAFTFLSSSNLPTTSTYNASVLVAPTGYNNTSGSYLVYCNTFQLSTGTIGTNTGYVYLPFTGTNTNYVWFVQNTNTSSTTYMASFTPMGISSGNSVFTYNFVAAATGTFTFAVFGFISSSASPSFWVGPTNSIITTFNIIYTQSTLFVSSTPTTTVSVYEDTSDNNAIFFSYPNFTSLSNSTSGITSFTSTASQLPSAYTPVINVLFPIVMVGVTASTSGTYTMETNSTTLVSISSGSFLTNTQVGYNNFRAGYTSTNFTVEYTSSMFASSPQSVTVSGLRDDPTAVVTLNFPLFKVGVNVGYGSPTNSFSSIILDPIPTAYIPLATASTSILVYFDPAGVAVGTCTISTAGQVTITNSNGAWQMTSGAFIGYEAFTITYSN